MTIRVYALQTILDGATKLTRKFARFELIVGSRLSSNARPVMTKIEFGVAGESDAGVEEAGIQIAEEILAMTACKGMKFSKVMGHYRQDETLPVLAANVRNVATVGHSPDPENGLEAVNLQITIPGFNGSVADATNLIGDRTVQTDEHACIGYCRWQDQEETELEAMYSDVYRGVNIVSMEKLYNEPFTSDNSANGLGDNGVLGPKI